MVCLTLLLFISSVVFALSLDDVSTGGSNFFDNIMSFFRNFFGIQSEPQCHAGCCGAICGGCPSGQFCDVDNGACPDGTSCGPGGQHLACVGDQCVNVPGEGADECSSHGECGGMTTTTDVGDGDCTGYTNCYCINPSTGGCCPPETCPVSGLDCHFDVDAGSCSYGQYMFCGYGGNAECRGAPNDCLNGCHESLGSCPSGYSHEDWDISQSDCDSRASSQGKQAHFMSTSSYSCPNCDNPTKCSRCCLVAGLQSTTTTSQSTTTTSQSTTTTSQSTTTTSQSTTTTSQSKNKNVITCLYTQKKVNISKEKKLICGFIFL